jgi:hypothetical protein
MLPKTGLSPVETNGPLGVKNQLWRFFSLKKRFIGQYSIILFSI